MDIWHVDNKNQTGLMLMRTEGSNFIVIQDGSTILYKAGN